MGLFKRRGGRPPEWSPITDPDAWEAFAELISDEVAARGWSVDLEEGWATDGASQFGLFNVAGKCGQLPRSRWPEVVNEHFVAIAATADRVAISDDPGFTDADAARAAMKARLVTDEFLAVAEDVERVGRRVAEDLQLVVAYDLPDNVMIPERGDLLRFGPDEELLELAIAQARAEPGLELERYEIPGANGDPAAPLFALSGESFFTATHALWAHEFDPPESEHGTLVGMPVRNLVLAHPIRDKRVIGMIAPMLQLTQRYCDEGPGSLTPSLYWLREGRLERLDAWIGEEGPHVAPSPAFIEMLERL